MSVGLASGFLLEDGMRRLFRPVLTATIGFGVCKPIEEKTQWASLTRGRGPSQVQRQAAFDNGSGL